MSATLLATVQKELGAPASRDLTALVQQVKAILPQFSDDAVCEALVQVDEDVSRAVECLLSRPPPQKKAGKKKKEPIAGAGSSQAPGSPARSPESPLVAPQAAPPSGPAGRNDRTYSGGSGQQPANGKEDEPVEDDRPKTAADKEAQKQRKKLRDIERIEEKLARGEKVDPLQLPKLEKKREVEDALAAAEAIVRKEAAAREEARRKELEEARAAREAELREERERRERDRSQAAQRPAGGRPSAPPTQAPTQPAARPSQARQAHDSEYNAAAQWHPTVHQGKDSSSRRAQEPKSAAAGNELLSMLHANNQDQNKGAYSQTADLARQLGGGVMPQQFRSQQHYQQQHAPSHQQQQSRAPARQAYTQNARHTEDYDLINEYSTPLDENRFTPEQRAAAERIANEIERESGREAHQDDAGPKGGRGGRYNDGPKGYGGGKGNGHGGKSSYHGGGKGKKGGKNRWQN
eukprot:TRINITY_DN14384_c0_g2_i1.p2 TRINITY_DN14384_c0_g2~~TRINITY_DN14384_c0_g2_i1.p2  ORF type:complete len:464 (+),score=126.10 TRINITY_DN14384_c0_g2_i1:90-1481(+)